jgi:PAS domain S-box-containing protein
LALTECRASVGLEQENIWTILLLADIAALELSHRRAQDPFQERGVRLQELYKLAINLTKKSERDLSILRVLRACIKVFEADAGRIALCSAEPAHRDQPVCRVYEIASHEDEAFVRQNVNYSDVLSEWGCHDETSMCASIKLGSEKEFGQLAILPREKYRYLDHDRQSLELFAHLLATDIDRRRKQADLEKSEARFRAVFEQAPSGLFIQDSNGKFTHVNPYLADLLGVEASDIEGKTDYQLFGTSSEGDKESINTSILHGKKVYEQREMVAGDRRMQVAETSVLSRK